jgi:hypothetical protein
MKKAFSSLLLVALLGACADDKNSDTGGGMAEPTSSNCSLDICSNSWMSYADSTVGDYFIYRFTDTTLTVTNDCHNGLKAKVTVAAKVSANMVQVIQTAKKRETRGNDWCEVTVLSKTLSYSIINGQLHVGGTVFNRY